MDIDLENESGPIVNNFARITNTFAQMNTQTITTYVVSVCGFRLFEPQNGWPTVGPICVVVEDTNHPEKRIKNFKKKKHLQKSFFFFFF